MTSAASSRAKQQQASKPAVVSQSVATATQWQGPLPPPDALEKFNTIVERGAERVFRMTEIEQRHRIESERAALDSNILAFKAENMARGLRMKTQGDTKGLVVQTLVRASWLILLAFTTLQAQAKTASEVFEQVSPSVVVVYGYDAKGKKQSQGSGVVLPGGDVATNCHVLKGTPDYSVNYRDKTYPAKIRHSDWDRDVCSLTVPGLNAMPATLGATRNLKVGQRVYVIGAPRGLELTLSEGIVSSLREMDSGRYIQTTAPISPGSSGGGLFDDKGSLIGLPTFYLDKGQQLNFAVPVEWVKALPGRHATQAHTGQSGIKWFNQAIALHQKQDYPALLQHVQRWTKAEPRSSSAWVFFGIAYGEVGQSAKEIEAYQQALRIDPEDAAAWNNLGNAYGKAGQSAKAIEALQQALRIDPENADAWLLLGANYGTTHQFDKAIEAFQQALRIDPENAGTWYLLGVTYKQTDKAIEAMQQALRIDPEHVNAWNFLGQAYLKTGQAEKAIGPFQQVLRINPENVAAWDSLGLAFSLTDQAVKAIEAYKQALRINPELADVWHGLGISYGESGQITKAIEALQQALRINPDDAASWFYLGLSYKQTGQTKRVMEVYRRLKILDPSKAEEFFTKVVLP